MTSPTICTYELKQCSPATPSWPAHLGPLLCGSFCLSLLYAVLRTVLTQSRCSIPSVRGTKMNAMPLLPQHLFIRFLCRSVCKGTPSTGAAEWPPGSTGQLTPKVMSFQQREPDLTAVPTSHNLRPSRSPGEAWARPPLAGCCAWGQRTDSRARGAC